ncbi:DUF418 domain-containing protein [Nocardiopsis sp. ATB16-24]|uniref:DUF418 domain-containing protein n=1 Tax=Nocardiopsis sp. ATB16-24 TaxID=3019555 RepID=UPI002556E710|nr:DUF418 domain-containing protein [Nocardiopsis sp. ATB16-24]
MSGHTVSRGPVNAGERALAPDLARGSMLLFIAIANTVWYLWAFPRSGVNAHPVSGNAWDSAAQFLTVVMIDMRSYPMFAFLFGYGMVQLARRQEAAGTDERDVDALLRRRNLWLIAFGLVHAALLWIGDVLGAYGLAGLLLGWLLFRRRDTTVLLWAGVLTGLMLLLSAFSLLGPALTPGDATAPEGFGTEQVAANISEVSPVAAALERLLFWPLVSLSQGLMSLAVPTAILLGFWAARRRVLEEPGRHLVLLRRVALVGIGVGWAGGLPAGLAQVGLWDLSPLQNNMLSMPHMVTGLAGGVGYVALITLVAYRLQERGRTDGVLVGALSATGKRSLSAYLAQSLLCAPLLAAWGLGLGAELRSWSMLLFAVGVWSMTVIAAYALERADRRGPAEALLRRLTYRRPDRGSAGADTAAEGGMVDSARTPVSEPGTDRDREHRTH